MPDERSDLLPRAMPSFSPPPQPNSREMVAVTTTANSTDTVSAEFFSAEFFSALTSPAPTRAAASPSASVPFCPAKQMATPPHGLAPGKYVPETVSQRPPTEAHVTERQS